MPKNLRKLVIFFLMVSLFTLSFGRVFALSLFQRDINLKSTSSSLDISNLQQFLNGEGFYKGPIDGIYNSQIFKAVKDFQKKYGISPTGYFGKLSRAKANEIISKAKNSITSSSLWNFTSGSVSELQLAMDSLSKQVLSLQNKAGSIYNSSNNTKSQTNTAKNPQPISQGVPQSIVSNSFDFSKAYVNFPLVGSTISGTSTAVSVFVSPDMTPLGVQFKIDNNDFGAEDLKAPFVSMLNTRNYTNGVHSITAKIREKGGSVFVTPNLFITIENSVTQTATFSTSTAQLLKTNQDMIVNTTLKQGTSTQSLSSSTQPKIIATSITQTKKLVWGAYVGDSKADLGAFESKVGQPVDIRSVFYALGDDFPMQYKTSIGEAGKTLLLFWEPAFGYDQINEGKHDALIRKFAQDAKAYSYPVILSPFHEMNGNWSPWGYGMNGNTPAKFILAWKRIRTMFSDATNVKFALVYNSYSKPNITGNQISDYYPGDEYVDYVGVDGFNFGNPWMSFYSIFNDSLSKLSKYNKPIYIFSMGSVPGDKKAEWIKDSLGVQIYKYPKVQGFVWFNQNGHDGNWLIDTDPNSLSAFKEVIPK
jgi:mannan endo-1,4-beta-mannosidase